MGELVQRPLPQSQDIVLLSPLRVAWADLARAPCGKRETALLVRGIPSVCVEAWRAVWERQSAVSGHLGAAHALAASSLTWW